MTWLDPTATLDARFSEDGATATPWAEVLAVLEAAELFWISTVRADGRPHVTPLSAVWSDAALYFCTGPTEQKAVNLAGDPRCVLTTGTNGWKTGLDIVVEGRAEQVLGRTRLTELASAWSVKYHGEWDFDVADGAFLSRGETAFVFGVVPAKVLAFAKGGFAQTSYRI